MFIFTAVKKTAAIISFIIYFAATTGVVINSHYCMKRLVSVHLYEQKAKVCGQCGMGMHDNKGCCHDVVKVHKLVQDQVQSPALHFELPPATAGLPAYSDLLFASLYNAKEPVHSGNHSPPLLSQQDTYLRIGVFRI